MANEGASRILTDAEHEEMLAYLSTKAHSERNTAMYFLGWKAGLRVGTVSQIKLSDVLDSEGKLKSRVILRSKIMKGGKNSAMYLKNANLRQAIENYLKVRPKLAKVDTLFVTQKGTSFSANTLSRTWYELFQKAGYEDATFHGLRAAFATQVLKKGYDIVALKELMNHSDISTTQRYVRHNQDYLGSIPASI